MPRFLLPIAAMRFDLLDKVQDFTCRVTVMIDDALAQLDRDGVAVTPHEVAVQLSWNATQYLQWAQGRHKEAAQHTVMQDYLRAIRRVLGSKV